MNGAREYARLFSKKEKHGRLLIISGEHARGKYFHIYVMPEGETANHYGHTPTESVEVYGILGGQPGWTEYYGWLHSGPWQDDFAKLVEKRRSEIAERNRVRSEKDAIDEADRKLRTQKALATYSIAAQAVAK